MTVEPPEVQGGIGDVPGFERSLGGDAGDNGVLPVRTLVC